MAVANSVSALRAGCSNVHCTINGLGERAEKPSLEEIAIVLKNLYGIDKGLKTGVVMQHQSASLKAHGQYGAAQ